MVELHRDSRKLRRDGALLFALGVVGVLMPDVATLMGRRFVVGPWLWYFLGGVLILVGGYGLVRSLRPFKLVVTEETLTVRSSALNATIPWSSLEFLTVTRTPGGPETGPVLVLYPAPGIDLGVKLAYKVGGRKGYWLLHLNDFVESPDQVLGILRRYAGEKLVVVDGPPVTKG